MNRNPLTSISVIFEIANKYKKPLSFMFSLKFTIYMTQKNVNFTRKPPIPWSSFVNVTQKPMVAACR